MYELPLEFNLQLWTAKSRDEDCALRAYTHDNATDWKQHAFGMEVALYEQVHLRFACLMAESHANEWGWRSRATSRWARACHGHMHVHPADGRGHDGARA